MNFKVLKKMKFFDCFCDLSSNNLILSVAFANYCELLFKPKHDTNS